MNMSQQFNYKFILLFNVKMSMLNFMIQHQLFRTMLPHVANELRAAIADPRVLIESDPHLIPVYQDMHDRLTALMKESCIEPPPVTLQTFETFARGTYWEHSNKSWTIFDQPIQRVQLNSSLCFMHAPTTMCQYLNPMKHVYCQDWLLHPYCTLEDYVTHGRGDNSWFVLRAMLPANGELSKVNWSHENEIIQFLHNGPGLISQFNVHKDFMCVNTRSHFGAVCKQNKKIGLHSMLLVGYRKDDNDHLIFLVQNWWMTKQFVEMDAAYLQSCGADLWMISTTTNMKRNIQMQYSQTNLDVAEEFGSFED